MSSKKIEFERGVPRTEFLFQLEALTRAAKGFRKRAFANAIESLKGISNELLYYNDLHELKGFGEGILNRFLEYQSTGQLKELILSAEEQERKRVLDLFQGIYGVGEVTATVWYEKGLRSLEDLIKFNIPLTDHQRVGLYYYNQINSRIERKEIDEFNQQLQKKVVEFNQENKVQIEMKICGSYLRGKTTSGDIDVIVREKNDQLPCLIDSLLKHLYPLVRHILGQGNVKILTLGGSTDIHRRIDFELVENARWPFALLYFTGSKDFNRQMREIAKKKGLLLNQRGLFYGNQEFLYKEEKDIFDALGMTYLSPEQR